MNIEKWLALLFYVVPAALLLKWWMWRKARETKRNIQLLEQNQKDGLTEPASLHPLIDSLQCIGCSSCVRACPEGDVLGLVDAKASLINPTHCIGHGACAAACPVGAITLVFGTEKRGVDVPNVDKDFQTNVPGIYIAGELGGMGLIRNAMEQGKQAITSITEHVKQKAGDDLDVLIVGAGPAGIAATVCAKHNGLRYRTIEQEMFGGTVAHYPRGKLVMTKPVTLPSVGFINLGETSKEVLMEVYEGIQKKTDIEIHYGEKMDTIKADGDAFVLTSNLGTYRAKTILLAIGRRGSPRKLGVPGEDQTKVLYSLIDPAQYQHRHVLIVGGGDSALEAALSIAEEPGSTVTLSFRGASFSRAKPKNRERIEEAEKAGKVKTIMNSNVTEIKKETVVIATESESLEIRNDFVIVNAGGVLPMKTLKEVGIQVDTKFGTR